MAHMEWVWLTWSGCIMTYCILSQTIEDLHLEIEKRDEEIHNGLYHAKKVRIALVVLATEIYYTCQVSYCG